MNQIVLDIPDEILLALKVSRGEAGAALRMAAAAGFGRRERAGVL